MEKKTRKSEPKRFDVVDNRNSSNVSVKPVNIELKPFVIKGGI